MAKLAKSKSSPFKSTISIVRGVSVSQVRSILSEAGFKEEDIQIQGVDIDELDRDALQAIFGKDLKNITDLPIVVRGIGIRSLSILLKKVRGAKVISKGQLGLSKTVTGPTLSIPVKGRKGSISLGEEPLVLEGVTRADLERALASAGFDLSQVRVRPLTNPIKK